MLQERFRSLTAGSEDWRTEIKKNVMESAIMNAANPDELRLTPLQLVGLAAVNAVRMVSLKPFLRLSQDQEQLARVKLAFLYERNRRFDAAIKTYRETIPGLKGSAPDLHAFSQLHLGYCLAVSGDREAARTALEAVRSDHAGSHFAETASVLLRLLEQNERAQEEIEARELTPLERARAFFVARLYSRAAEAFQALRPLAPMDEYRFRRSQEETGKVQEAITGYRAIVTENRDPEAVREANRRLLLIGHFYGGDRETRQFAEQTAQQIGDSQAVSTVRQAAAEQRSAVVLQEIYQSDKPELADLREQAAAQIEEAEERAVAVVVPEPQPPDVAATLTLRSPAEPGGFRDRPEGFVESLRAIREPAPLVLTPALQIRTRDGRTLRGESIRFSAGRAIFAGEYATEAPISELALVQSGDGESSLQISLTDGRRWQASRLVINAARARAVLSGGAAEEFDASLLLEVRIDAP